LKDSGNFKAAFPPVHGTSDVWWTSCLPQWTLLVTVVFKLQLFLIGAINKDALLYIATCFTEIVRKVSLRLFISKIVQWV